ncbi:helix-turn-helix domain-containing protein [Denitrobaculum tricleocarpae]|uniref:Helix-turn-helix domain-containing protein n=1 Tax=Denitrobaculum tricleocarpae TaxID=2591009 RepID=A0A545TN14_9PROT|nr:AraC family transcriptional regulator [Denitrobaculum tricleocarpae]TQV78568.1 helix-turn-helix domain-containing protein [Denitrobaculum tricleocarpae]
MEKPRFDRAESTDRPWTDQMPDQALLNLLPTNAETAGLPALTVPQEEGSPPEYPLELYRLYLANRGDIALTLDSQSMTLKKGQLLTLSPGEVVAFSEGQTLISLSFHHDFFCVRVQRDEVYCDGVVFNRLSGLPVVAFPETEHTIVEGRFHEMISILSNPSPFSHDRALNVLRALLLHAADYKSRATAAELHEAGKTKHLSPLVLQFQHLVEETFAQRKEATFYSEALGVTLSKLNRRVKDELGKSVMQAVNERLAIEARVALRSGKRSIKEVAFDLGFIDPLYFSRFFRKQFGRPPSQYFQSPVQNEA